MLKSAILVFSIFASFSSLQLFEEKSIDTSLMKLNTITLGNHDTTNEEDENYLFFCNGVPCQNHDIKSVIKEITNEGRYIYFEPEELAQLDFSTLEDWQIIKYSFEELNAYWAGQVKENCRDDVVLCVAASKVDWAEKEDIGIAEANKFAQKI